MGRARSSSDTDPHFRLRNHQQARFRGSHGGFRGSFAKVMVDLGTLMEVLRDPYT